MPEEPARSRAGGQIEIGECIANALKRYDMVERTPPDPVRQRGSNGRWSGCRGRGQMA
jgi:hypothetical protein